MRNIFTLTFVSFVLLGCAVDHESINSAYEQDFFGPAITVGDAGMFPGDGGPIVLADAGSDAFVPPMDDAGSDAGTPPEPDSGPVEDAGPVPDFVIEAYNMQPSGIRLHNTSMSYSAAGYRVGRGESLASVDVVLDGDAADVSFVEVWNGGHLLGTGTFPSGINPTVRISFTEIFATPMDDYGYLTVAVRIPSLVDNATSGGVHDGNPMSGDSFRIGLNAAERFVGATSVETTFDPIMGNAFVIRAGAPNLLPQTLSTTTLANGSDQDLYRFLALADGIGGIGSAPIAIRQIGMVVSVHARDGYGEVCNLHLRRGSTDLPADSYTIFALEVDRSGSGRVYESPCVYGRGGSGQVIIRFVDEETISGIGNAYTLHGTVNLFASGDWIDTSFGFGGLGETVYLDTLITTGYIASGIHTLEIDTSPYGMPGTTLRSPVGASFLWSDLSEVPHSALEGTAGGSRDWTNGYLIGDLTQVQTLTAP